MMRVLVVDDETVVGLGIRAILEAAGYEVVATTADVREAVAIARSIKPEVIVSDVMFDTRPLGLELPSMLAAASLGDIPVLFLSSWDMPYLVKQARENGAAGYLSKTADLETLIRGVESAAAGVETTFPNDTAERPPTPREIQIMVLVAEGLTSGEIGQRLGLSTRTVEGYVLRLTTRYGVVSRAHLVATAMRKGWITLGRAEGANHPVRGRLSASPSAPSQRKGAATPQRRDGYSGHETNTGPPDRRPGPSTG